jgi:hypothetical protein
LRYSGWSTPRYSIPPTYGSRCSFLGSVSV